MIKIFIIRQTVKIEGISKTMSKYIETTKWELLKKGGELNDQIFEIEQH